ncbi:hypothetical protein [Crocosphaera chwakensis]|uniref:Uncharacterized protein n=1 Tax=Crocosphaera chwakensis CCY0110 TaxID=391612 RepID=A3IT09_9CHRO|nr:hypothetical protein [Crocosphaera chwakensis]EAZ90440.1 hypothetical protein CY0110_28944 [Crocosphaera chwakensis CCY0110]
MLKTLSFKLIKTGLGVIVSLTSIHILTHTSQAAILRLSPDSSSDNLTLEEITPQNFIESDLFSQLIPTKEGITTVNNSFSSQTITEAVSQPSNISLESVVSSLSQIDLEAERDGKTQEVPILPQVDPADIYKEIYDFGTTVAEDLSDPISAGVLPALEGIPAPRGGVGIRERGGQVAGIPSPTLNQSSLPRFGGPVAIIGNPSANFTNPLRQVALPSASRVQANNWGDDKVNVFFASLPQEEVVDIDIFMRTVYRTNMSDMIKQIDESLDTTIDTEFHSMPAEIFPSNPMPSGEYNRSL